MAAGSQVLHVNKNIVNVVRPRHKIISGQNILHKYHVHRSYKGSETAVAENAGELKKKR